jgi:hypothetical protein
VVRLHRKLVDQEPAAGLDLARRIQRRFLPGEPPRWRLHCAIEFHPAYEVGVTTRFLVAGGGLAVAGRRGGKGVSAALHGRLASDRACQRRPVWPSEILARLNRAMLAGRGGHTRHPGCLAPGAGLGPRQVANAGHLPPLVLEERRAGYLTAPQSPAGYRRERRLSGVDL